MVGTLKNGIVVILCAVCICSAGYAQDEKAFLPKVSYTGDVINNFSGGGRRSLQYMGLLDVGFQLNTEAARWWKGGTFSAEVLSTHGKGVSATTIYDMQAICSIEAGNHALLAWELWYHQQLGRFGIRGGLMNITDDFMCQPFTDAFSGSSYGTFPTLSLNYSLPNYPTAGLGLAASYQINANWSALTALFNGRVADIDEDRFNMKWRANPRKDGVLSMTELKYVSDSTQFPAHMFGIGAVYHNKRFPSIRDVERSYANNYTFYAFGEHDFYQREGRTAGAFLQGSYAVKNRNVAYGYSAVGLVASGFFSRSRTDVAGIGLTQLYYQSAEEDGVRDRTEHTIEVFVRYNLNKYVTIKPTFYTIFSHPKTVVTAAMVEFGINLF